MLQSSNAHCASGRWYVSGLLLSKPLVANWVIIKYAVRLIGKFSQKVKWVVRLTFKELSIFQGLHMAPITTHYAEPSEQTLEGLSALTDGETSAFEGRRLLNMANDPELEAKWQSYHLAGALMRKELEGAPLKDLSVSIATALADEPVFSASLNQPDATELSASISNRVDRSHSTGRLSSTNSLLGGRWRDFAAKSAIAASVAFAIVVGVQYTQTDGVGDVNTGEEFAVQSAPVVTAPSGFNVPSPVARNVSLGSLAEPQRELQSAQPSQHQFLSNAQVEAELQQLFLEHAELSSQNGKFGLMPMARAAKMQSAEK